jgi:catalase
VGERRGREVLWVKYHFKTEQGIQNMTDAEARAMRAEDLDYHRRDLWEAISAQLTFAAIPIAEITRSDRIPIPPNL